MLFSFNPPTHGWGHMKEMQLRSCELDMLEAVANGFYLHSTWVFVNLGAIFRTFKTCPNCSLGLLVVWSSGPFVRER